MGTLRDDLSSATEAEEMRVARLITSSIAGTRWRELTPLDIARHLVANGVRVAIDVQTSPEASA